MATLGAIALIILGPAACIALVGIVSDRHRQD